MAGFYGNHFKNSPAARLLTELALWSLDLQPRLMMTTIRTRMCEPASHYTRAIAVSRYPPRHLPLSEQHDQSRLRPRQPAESVLGHCHARAAHEVPGVAKGRVYDRAIDQISIAATLAEVMGVRAERAEGGAFRAVP